MLSLSPIFYLISAFHIDLVTSIQCISYNEPETNSTSIQNEFSYNITEDTVNATRVIETCRDDSDSCYVLWADFKNGTVKVAIQVNIMGFFIVYKHFQLVTSIFIH